MIGTPSEADMSFITDTKALQYILKFNPKAPEDLRRRYPDGSDDALRILRSMLQFNPFTRPSADQLLNDPYFDEVRKFSQAFDSQEQVSFDFENQ